MPVANQTNYEIITLQLITRADIIDLTDKLLNFEIYEDIHSPFMLGQIDLFDTTSLVESGEIVGEKEEIEFTLKITGQLAISDRIIEGSFFVYKIEDELEAKNKADIIRLRLVSKSFFKNSEKRNRKFYEATQSDIVEEIITEQLEGKIIRVDKTELEQRYIFPNWHPIACINELSNNSRSAAYKGEPDYVLYEDLDGYHYVSMSYMMDETNGLVLPTVGDKWFRNQLMMDNLDKKYEFNVVSHHKKQAFDVVDNMKRGMYGATMIDHNIAKRKWRQNSSGYSDTFASFSHLADNELTHRGLDNAKNRFQLIPSNSMDSPGVYPEEVFPEDRRKIAIRELQSEQNLFVLHIEGEPGKPGNEMKIGRPLYFDIRSKKGGLDDDTEHDLLNGKFLITRIRHVFMNDKYIQLVQMAKDAYETWI